MNFKHMFEIQNYKMCTFSVFCSLFLCSDFFFVWSYFSFPLIVLFLYYKLWYTNSKTEEENKRDCMKLFYCLCIDVFFFSEICLNGFLFYGLPPLIREVHSQHFFFCFVCDLVLRFTHIQICALCLFLCVHDQYV